MPETLADILGIAPGNDKPNAYELLGLPVCEADPERIQSAIDGTVKRLKRSQNDTDEALWKQAAAAVSKARKLLIDPQLKSKYDAKLSKRSTGASKSRVRGEAAIDPLRGLLPAMDPLAPFDVDAAANRAAQSRRIEPPPLPPPTETEGDEDESWANGTSEVGPPAVPPTGMSDVTSDGAITAAAIPLVKPSSARRRRRGSPVLVAVFVLLMVGMLGGVGWGVYTIVQRERARGDAGAMAQADPKPRAAAPPTRPANRNRVDPVMGGIGPRTSGRTPDLDSLPPLKTNVDVAMPAPMNDTPSATQPSDTPEGSMPEEGDTAPAPDSMPAMEPAPPTGPTADELQAGQTAITAAETAIRSQQWKQMKALAEKAQAAAADDAQKQTAGQLFEVADLADYYYHGIVKAMGDLPSGNTFMLTAGIEVAVVESSAEQITLQVQGRPKPFPFDEMPFLLAHKLGSFTMSENDPTVIAAKAVFQSLAKIARPADREQAAEWLRELPEDVNGSHPHQIAETLARLFPASS